MSFNNPFKRFMPKPETMGAAALAGVTAVNAAGEAQAAPSVDLDALTAKVERHTYGPKNPGTIVGKDGKTYEMRNGNLVEVAPAEVQTVAARTPGVIVNPVANVVGNPVGEVVSNPVRDPLQPVTKMFPQKP